MQKASILLVVFGSCIVVRLAGQADDRIGWGDCSITADLPIRAECATVALPLKHGVSGAGTIELALKRVPPERTKMRQLWFLDGGPGDAGTASVERLARLLDDPDLEILTFDHRGTGGSALLECPEEQAEGSHEGREISREEWPSCIDYLREHRDDLDGLSVTQVAHDLHELIEQNRVSDVPVFVMGASYGSFLAQRYLQMYPDQADGVILDGIVPPDWGFDEFDAGLDETGRSVLARCAGDSTCAAHLGTDPVGRAEQLLVRQSEGHCFPLTLEPAVTRMVLGVGLMVDEIPPGLLAAIVFRLDRCTWYDQMAVLHLFNNTFDSIEEAPSHSPVLQRHVSMSELWSADAPSKEELRAALEGYVMTTEVSLSFSATADSWPVYARPTDGSRFPSYDGPMLLMHGGLDPTMPLARLEELRDWYDGPDQHFFVLEDAGHVVVNESQCAVSLYRGFLAAPTTPPDTTCLADAAPLNFAVSAEDSKRLLGTPDLWGDRVPVFRSVVFFALYRWGALALGLVGLVLGVASWGKVRETPPSLLRVSLCLVAWLAVVLVLWQVLFFLPYLLPFLAVFTVAIAVGALATQTMLALWLARRLFSGSRLGLRGSKR